VSEIISSTGGLGLAVRSYDRLQLVPEIPPADAGELGDLFSTLLDAGAAKGVGRVMLKTIVSAETATAVFAGSEQVSQAVEAGIPLGLGTGEWLIYLAQNEGDRRHSADTYQEIAARVAADANRAQYRLDAPEPSAVERLAQDGMWFTDHIAARDLPGIARLWGPTFEWDEGAVQALSARLDASRTLPPGARDVWFNALKNRGGAVVSLAMAERLDIPGPTGPVPVVESTEWATAPLWRGQGFSDAVITALNDKILDDLPGAAIIAECNVRTGAHRVALRSGFDIPIVPWGNRPGILSQNVAVNGELTDFAVVSLSEASRSQHVPGSGSLQSLMIRSNV